MSTVKSKKLQVGTDATSSNNFTIYQPATPDGTLRIGVGNAENPTEVGRFNSNGFIDTNLSTFFVRRSLNNAQNISSATWTKVEFDEVRHDNKSFYNTTTNQFKPTIAGYYQFNFGIYAQGTSISNATVVLRKNGDEQAGARGTYTPSGVSNAGVCVGSGVIYLNGSTDYVEVYGYITATSPYFHGHPATTLNGFLVQQA